MAFTPEERDNQDDFEGEKDIAIEIIHRYSDADKAAVRVIEAEILTRIEQVYQFYRVQEAEIKLQDRLNLSEDDADSRNWEIHHRIREQLGLPHGIHALGAEGPLTTLWRQSARRLAKLWIAGKLSYEQCIDLLWVLDEQYDLDPHYLLFGLPNESMSWIQMRALKAFIFEHGPRRFVRTHVQLPGDVPF